MMASLMKESVRTVLLLHVLDLGSSICWRLVMGWNVCGGWKLCLCTRTIQASRLVFCRLADLLLQVANTLDSIR